MYIKRDVEKVLLDSADSFQVLPEVLPEETKKRKASPFLGFLINSFLQVWPPARYLF